MFAHSHAVNSANYLFVQALQQVKKLNHVKSFEAILEELEHLYLGQSWDLYWEYTLQCLSEAEYINMVDNKTGGLFRMRVRLMQLQSDTGIKFDFETTDIATRPLLPNPRRLSQPVLCLSMHSEGFL